MKVYVAAVVLSIVGGVHVPVIGVVFVEDGGNDGAAAPLHKAIGANVGVTPEETVVVNEVETAH